VILIEPLPRFSMVVLGVNATMSVLSFWVYPSTWLEEVIETSEASIVAGW